ncbi:hypothetical protein POV27_12815 [Aureisphaera galaxeae]|uniref:NADase-type glycan-binding domain-containing protein n=1 Tax=Aureisphaera galaxeae TaxID=1538023 RepID=UPI00234FCB8A|nr:hypothetical protein [Aureisphaera galaxeae]MDC8004936.1 hypothetical protein [Aureisphaera galaxeae]
MKITLTVFLFCWCAFVFGQDITVLESKQEKDSDFFDYADYAEEDGKLVPIGGLEFLKGCSWYCGGSVNEITASSELAQNGSITYEPDNAHDFNEKTAWVEGVEGYGIGESIEYVFDFIQDPIYNTNLGVNKLIIANGYKKSRSAWENNSRIKQLLIYINDEPKYLVNLKDSFEIQTVAFETIKFFHDRKVRMKFEIKDVYEGKKYKDTALSLLMFDGVGVH